MNSNVEQTQWGSPKAYAQAFYLNNVYKTLIRSHPKSTSISGVARGFGFWGRSSRHAFGHLGLINKFAWADPERELSASLLTTGLPMIAQHIPPLVNVIRSIANRIPKVTELQLFALKFEKP